MFFQRNIFFRILGIDQKFIVSLKMFKDLRIILTSHILWNVYCTTYVFKLIIFNLLLFSNLLLLCPSRYEIQIRNKEKEKI